MSTPKFQFSVRSLLILAFFVAVICSIGVWETAGSDRNNTLYGVHGNGRDNNLEVCLALHALIFPTPSIMSPAAATAERTSSTAVRTANDSSCNWRTTCASVACICTLLRDRRSRVHRSNQGAD
jgi:hypothetical protein